METISSPQITTYHVHTSSTRWPGAVAAGLISVGAGWIFGNNEWVKKNFEAVIIMIIVISIIPIGVEFVLARIKSKKESKPIGPLG